MVVPNPLNPGIQLAPGRLWEFLGENGQPFRPFPAQLDALTQIRIPWPGLRPDGTPYPLIYGLNCGRRFGKTTLGEKIAWHGVLAPNDHAGPPTVRITADTEEHGRKIWDKFIHHLHNTPLKALLDTYSRERELVTLKTGATAQLLSANNPATLSGDGVTLWLIDEAQFLTQDAWNNLFPSISDRNGVIVALGVAEGEGPYREICFNGDSPDHPEYLRLSYPTSANPYVQPWAIEFARRTLSPTKFKQLYLAQWEGEVGAIFRNVDACVLALEPIQAHPDGWGYLELPKPGHVYYCGLDLARFSDWTVFLIADRRGKIVAWDRFSRVDWELQKARLYQISAHYYHPRGYGDATGLGDPVIEDLQKMGMNIQGEQITSNAKKNALVDAYAIRVGAGQIRYPNVPGLIREHKRYESKKSPRSNALIYGAPPGENDDWVMAGALLNKALPSVPSLPSIQHALAGSRNRRKSAAEYI